MSASTNWEAQQDSIGLGPPPPSRDSGIGRALSPPQWKRWKVLRRKLAELLGDNCEYFARRGSSKLSIYHLIITIFFFFFFFFFLILFLSRYHAAPSSPSRTGRGDCDVYMPFTRSAQELAHAVWLEAPRTGTSHISNALARKPQTPNLKGGGSSSHVDGPCGFLCSP
ncbi:hypothetical protein N7462_009959 [Penicillium macrosclerotiorum]|uniref:uncharacterized protein n=1 Tax=Penicillium macrosclerotiorum TaxID=303699 RepID=UPI00254677BC|nr:uncharacterized protein N7462_009959 [Penicillium macrosclerotiorum]KAJ5668889.1 hypothetical protein N7462_009959 [Penicillium macrosclerotiorum]